MLRLIEGDFCAGDFRGKQIQTEQLVPDEIVFLAPGAGLVECQAGMGAVRRHAAPVVDVLLGQFAVRGGFCFLAEHVAEFGVGAKSGDGFHGEIRIVGEGSGKVVGDNLFSGFSPFSSRYFAHLEKSGQYLAA